MPEDIPTPKSAEDIKAREKEIVREIHRLMWENRWGEGFRRTRKAVVVGVGGIVGVWAGLKVFRPKGLLNGPVVISVVAGAVLHAVKTMSGDVQALCQSDTPLGNTLRLHYQRLSTHNILIPHYRHATLHASKARAPPT